MCIFPHLFAWILHIWIFLPVVSKCIIHVLHLLCCMLSACLSRRRNFRESQRLQHSQEEWQAISKGFAWIQTFHLGDSCCMKTRYTKHNLSPLQSPQRDPSSSPWRLYFGQTRICFRLRVNANTKPAGLQRSTSFQKNICDVSVGGNLSVTFNHGHGLQAGGPRTLHYRPILLRWILPPPLLETRSPT